jgi:peptidyl-prolyl cis-trans isomerase SurA
MNRKHLFAILVILTIAASATFAAVATPAATVNLTKTTIISTAQLDSAVKSYESQGVTNVSALQVLQSMIGQELILQGAARDGVTLTEDQKDSLLASQKASLEQQIGQTMTDEQFQQVLSEQLGMTVSEYRDSIAQQYVIQSYVVSKKQNMFSAEALTPTDKEINTFYRKNASQFVNPEAVKISVILMNKTDDAQKNAEILAKLQGVLAQVKNGSITFEKAVSLYSEDTASKSKGGEVGWLTIDNTEYQNLFGEAFFNEAFDLDDGEITPEVIDSNIGYVILKVLQHTSFKVLSLTDPLSPTESATVTDYIVYLLQQQKASEVFNQASALVIDELTKEARINILYKEAN